MTPMPAQAPATALSPYLSLRQAVRPAIVTYTVLASEQERAGALADEAGQLLERGVPAHALVDLEEAAHLRGAWHVGVHAGLERHDLVREASLVGRLRRPLV